MILWSFCILSPGFAAAWPAADLKTRAAELGLAREPYWLTLVHYKRTVFGGWKSLVDDPRFFFAADGKTDPETELLATLEAFFSPPKEEEPHPTVRFPARLAWLSEKLDISPDRFPFDGEKVFRKFYDEINPGEVSLVFPAGYMNSPASMFGHTFLLIESAEGNRLLAHSVNYAAITDENFGPIFAFKGLFGMYRGQYSFLPYYQKIREYGDVEMRDMWEYELSLTPGEIERLVRHTVEMEDIYSDYFFIDENCSYNLLFLIEAARPETRITDAFGTAVEPIETLKAARDLGLADSAAYRPSLYSRIRYLSTRLSPEENEFVVAICRGRQELDSGGLEEFSAEKKIIALDLAADYLKFLAVRGKVTEEEYRRRFLSVLSARRPLGRYDPLKNIPVPEAPDTAHGSRRLSSETGYDMIGPYAGMSYRVSAHEIMDPDAGYTPNSEIVFGKFEIRLDAETRSAALRTFDLISLVSLPASDAYFAGPCYELRTGFFMNPSDKDRQETPSFRLEGATGLSTAVIPQAQVYVFAGFAAYFAPRYDYGTDFLLGGKAGLFVTAARWKGHFFASAYRAPVGRTHTRISAGIEGRFEIRRSVSLYGGYSWNRDYDYAWHRAAAGFSYYY